MITSSTIVRRKPSLAGGLITRSKDFEPMLAVAGDLPLNGAEFRFEWKWDGVRAICYCDRGKMTVRSRNQIDITSRYPELQGLARCSKKTRFVLDGEIVALDADGRSSFKLLQRRMHVGDPDRALQNEVPAIYVIFDLLEFKGKSVLNEPFAQRRRKLEKLGLVGANWQTTTSHIDRGEAMLQAARENGLEGIVAKQLDSRYEPGRRSAAWVKIKIIQRQEFVVAGWIPEAGGYSRRVGSILLGYYDHGRLHYAGRVGTGFNEASHELLTRRFDLLKRKKNPFEVAVPGKGVRFLAPATVAEIEFRRWPDGGLVQQGAFKGMRFDKNARQVVKERIAGPHETE